MPCNILTCTYGSHIIPQRYILCFLTFFGLLLSYSLRVCLNIAITEMVLPVHHNKTDPAVCFHNKHRHVEEATGGTDIKQNWTEEEQGLVLGAFFIGYVITHIPGGILADLFGGKHILSIGVAVVSLLTLLTPLSVYYGNWWCLMILRSIMGLAQGPLFPSVSTMLAKWVPLRERSTLGALTLTGAQIGTITGTFVSSVILTHSKNWSLVFYFWGMLGLIWYCIFFVFCYSEPAQHPFISSKEATMLEHEIGPTDRMKIPWKHILLDKAVIALIIGHVGHDWIFFLMVTDLPKYMSDVLNFDISENGVLSSVPYIGLWIVSSITGPLVDYAIKNEIMSIINARRLVTCIGHFGPATFVLGASYMGCNRDGAAAMFIIGITIMGTFYSGMRINTLDISKNFAGIVMAICNGLGALGFIPVPMLVGIIAKENTVEEWRIIYWALAVGVVSTTVIYCVLASGERAEWDKAPPT